MKSPMYNNLQEYVIEHQCIWIFLILIYVKWKKWCFEVWHCKVSFIGLFALIYVNCAENGIVLPPPSLQFLYLSWSVSYFFNYFFLIFFNHLLIFGMCCQYPKFISNVMVNVCLYRQSESLTPCCIGIRARHGYYLINDLTRFTHVCMLWTSFFFPTY